MATLSAHMCACVSDPLADAHALKLCHGSKVGQHHLADAIAAEPDAHTRANGKGAGNGTTAATCGVQQSEAC